MKSDDYKNGYNNCVERTINMLTQMIQSTECTSDMSLNDMLRLIRQRVLDDSFREHTVQGDITQKVYVHGAD